MRLDAGTGRYAAIVTVVDRRRNTSATAPAATLPAAITVRDVLAARGTGLRASRLSLHRHRRHLHRRRQRSGGHRPDMQLQTGQLLDLSPAPRRTGRRRRGRRHPDPERLAQL